MRTKQATRGVIGGALLSLAGLALIRSDAPVSAQSGGQQLPSVEARLSAWTQAKAGEKVPVAVSFSARLPDAQVEQIARRYGLEPYAVHMWSEGMSGVHRVDRSKASLTVIAGARKETVGMKQKAQQSNQARSQHFIQANPQEKVVNDRALEQQAKFLLKAAEQNNKILQAAQSGAPLIYGLEALGTADQIRQLAKDPAVKAAEPAVLSEGKAQLPPVTPPTEAQGRYQSAEIDNLKAADAYQRVQQKAGPNAKGGSQ